MEHQAHDDMREKKGTLLVVNQKTVQNKNEYSERISLMDKRLDKVK